MVSFIGIWPLVKKKLPLVCCLSVLIILSFGYGVAVERYRIFPYPILRASDGAAHDIQRWIERGFSQGAQSYTVSSNWIALSSRRGDLPLPGQSNQQTAALILDIDLDGLNDFVIGARQAAPALVWYRRQAAGWQRYVIDADLLPIEAGGAFHDIDNDGDLDIVMGEDYSGNKVYWWENPYPNYDPETGWQRYVIKDSGSKTHHDQVFGDFDGDGAAELAFWNQGARTLYVADIPSDPKAAQPWPFVPVYQHESGKSEGLAISDIDQDGRIDLVGGGLWFRDEGEGRLVPHLIDEQMRFTRGTAGQLKQGGWSEVVFVAGDEVGRLKWYEWNGQSWLGHDFLNLNVNHGHSLALADFDQDGNLDVFCAEMHTPGHGNPHGRRLDAKKKTQHAAEQERPDGAAARAAWRHGQPTLSPERLVLRAHVATGR